jgi:hypothetical protein
MFQIKKTIKKLTEKIKQNLANINNTIIIYIIDHGESGKRLCQSGF